MKQRENLKGKHCVVLISSFPFPPYLLLKGTFVKLVLYSIRTSVKLPPSITHMVF